MLYLNDAYEACIKFSLSSEFNPFLKVSPWLWFILGWLTVFIQNWGQIVVRDYSQEQTESLLFSLCCRRWLLLFRKRKGWKSVLLFNEPFSVFLAVNVVVSVSDGKTEEDIFMPTFPLPTQIFVALTHANEDVTITCGEQNAIIVKVDSVENTGTPSLRSSSSVSSFSFTNDRVMILEEKMALFSS